MDRASPPHWTRRRLTLSRTHRRVWLGSALLLVLATALALAGAVQDWQRAVVQALAIPLLFVALRLPEEVFKRATPVHRLHLAGGLLLVPVVLGLLPVPMALARWVAPGLAAAYPDASWTTLSLQPENTVGMLFMGTLALSVTSASAVFSSMRGGRTGAAKAAVWALGALVMVAACHAATDATSLFGVLPLHEPPGRYFAPMVNPNHTTTALLLLLPVALGQAITHWHLPAGKLAAVVTVSALALMLVIGSGGATLALGVVCSVGLLMTVKRRGVALGGAVAVIATLAVGAWAWVRWVEPTWSRGSFSKRVAQYSETPGLWSDYWLTGSGGGTYAQAYAPVHTLTTWANFRHAHSEPQEWLVETGLLGIAFAGAAWFVLPRLVHRDRARWWALGLLGVAVHACVDFPLHVPAILLLTAAALGVYRGGFGRPSRTNGAMARRVLGLLLAFQIGGTLWWTRAAVVNHEVPKLERVQDAPDAARQAMGRVKLLAPWRSEWRLAAGWLTEGEERAQHARDVVTRHPEDATALRRAATLLLSVGKADEAQRVLERAMQRAPSDYRTYVVYARMLRQTDPEASADAWAKAIVRWPWQSGVWGAPLNEGYAAFPIGLYWVDAISEAPAPWHAALGQLLTARGDHSAALLAYERASAQRRLYRWVPERALSMYGIGDREGAEAWLERAAPHNVRNLNYYTTRGTLMVAWGRPEEAVQTYLAGLTMLPDANQLGTRAVEVAATVSAEHAVETAEHLSAAGRLSPEAALVAGAQALSMGAHRRCVDLLEASRAVSTGPRDEARVLWSQCASGCDDCTTARD